MPDEKTSSLLSRLSHAAFTILGSAVALWIAVQLILQIWWVLAILGGITLLVAVVVWRWRARRRF